MVDSGNRQEDMFSEEENLLHEIQDQCSHIADELLTLVAKRAARIVNTWPVCVLSFADDYPNKFTIFDILSCEHQTKYWEEISPALEDAIDEALSTAYDSLSAKEKFFIEYSECYLKNQILCKEEIDRLVRDRFVEMLNNHWSETKKIQDFELKKKW